jgi:hypothetical protein
MSEKSQTEKIIDSLNSAYKADPGAIHSLICNVVPCNSALVDHPNVVVAENQVTKQYTVGALGLVNGVLSAAGLPLVAIKWSDTKDKDGRYTFLGFCEYTPVLVKANTDE